MNQRRSAARAALWCVLVIGAITALAVLVPDLTGVLLLASLPVMGLVGTALLAWFLIGAVRPGPAPRLRDLVGDLRTMSSDLRWELRRASRRRPDALVTEIAARVGSERAELPSGPHAYTHLTVAMCGRTWSLIDEWMPIDEAAGIWADAYAAAGCDWARRGDDVSVTVVLDESVSVGQARIHGSFRAPDASEVLAAARGAAPAVTPAPAAVLPSDEPMLTASAHSVPGPGEVQATTVLEQPAGHMPWALEPAGEDMAAEQSDSARLSAEVEPSVGVEPSAGVAPYAASDQTAVADLSALGELPAAPASESPDAAVGIAAPQETVVLRLGRSRSAQPEGASDAGSGPEDADRLRAQRSARALFQNPASAAERLDGSAAGPGVRQATVVLDRFRSQLDHCEQQAAQLAEVPAAESSDAVPAPTGDDTSAMAPVARIGAADPGLTLVPLDRQTGETIVGVAPRWIPAEGATIGRATTADVVLDNPRVSRRHARIERGPAGWTVTDAGSKCGTFVNGALLTEDVAVPVVPGDQVDFGLASPGGAVVTFRVA